VHGRDRTESGGCQELEGGGMGSWCLLGAQVLFCRMKKSYGDGDDGCRTL